MSEAKIVSKSKAVAYDFSSSCCCFCCYY